jgi:hypothetical protein
MKSNLCLRRLEIDFHRSPESLEDNLALAVIQHLQNLANSLRKTLCIGYVLPGPAKCFDKLLVTSALHQEEIKAKELYAARSLGTKVLPQRFQNTSSGDKNAPSIPAQ